MTLERRRILFIVARLLFNDGLITVFAFGGIYAAGTFGMSLAEVIQFGIAINGAAGAGALVFGFVDDRIGGKRTVLVSSSACSPAPTRRRAARSWRDSRRAAARTSSSDSSRSPGG